jgi:hypothetical protein
MPAEKPLSLVLLWLPTVLQSTASMVETPVLVETQGSENPHSTLVVD